MNKPQPVRRPKVLKEAQRLQKQHPDWSEQRCIAEAKARVLSANQTA